jgi:hypothetical protein
MEALVKGVWNRLARHKQRRVPFRLLRIDVPLDREGLGRLALIRREELEGFVEGLFGPTEELDLPERAHRALYQLSEIREFLWTVQEVRFDALDPATQAEITNMLGTLGRLTRIAEHEIHEAVLSCTRVRRRIQEPGMGSGAMPFAVNTWRQPFSRGRITLTTRPELRMGVVTSAQHHWDRAAQFRRHAEEARLAETREMYLRLARAEDAMAEMAERRQQNEVLATGQLTGTIPQDQKKPNGEG